MLSIIICSVSPENAERTKANIEKTINLEHEFIIVDNRIHKWSITKAYNVGAEQAIYPYLLFVHEDVLFKNQNWGEFIIGKLQEPDCGAIGYAGSMVMLDCYSGWPQSGEWDVMLLFQGSKNAPSVLAASNVSPDVPFREVVNLDGLGIFVRKEVWEEFRFDDENVTGFHCYDIDFSIRIAASKKYKNYVCCSLDAMVEHLSQGNYNQSWYADTIRLHDTKWKKLLPLYAEGQEPDSKYAAAKREKLDHYFLKKLQKKGYKEQNQVYRKFIVSYKMTPKHLGHCIEDTLRGIWKKIFNPSKHLSTL